jgi:hypothetical protein
MKAALVLLSALASLGAASPARAVDLDARELTAEQARGCHQCIDNCEQIGGLGEAACKVLVCAIEVRQPNSLTPGFVFCFLVFDSLLLDTSTAPLLLTKLFTSVSLSTTAAAASRGRISLDPRRRMEPARRFALGAGIGWQTVATAVGKRRFHRAEGAAALTGGNG